MAKDGRIQIRVPQGTKLVLNEFCENRGNGTTLTKFFEDVLQDYFEKNGLVELLALFQVANKMFDFDNLEEKDVLEKIRLDPIYLRLIK